jgi:hypothetical protein
MHPITPAQQLHSPFRDEWRTASFDGSFIARDGS